MPVWNKIVLDQEGLRKLYQRRRLSLAKIGKIYGCDAGVILRNLREYGISTRSLSEATTKVPVEKDQLVRWYWKEKLSMFDIADRLGCTHATIVYKFKKLGIKSRGHLGMTPPLILTRENVEYFYNKGLSLKKIAKIYHRSKGGIERRFKNFELTSRGNSNRACKYKKFDFSGNLEEKAYLAGFRLGDLNVKPSVSVLQVRCSTTHRAQIQVIRGLFSKYTTPHIWKAKRGTMEIVCLVNRSFDFLIPKKDVVPEWVLKDDALFWSFFAGYSDAEGSYGFKRPGKFGKTRIGYFSIQSQDKNAIVGLANKLESIDVECYGPVISKQAGQVDKRGVKNNKDVWRFDVIKKRSLWIMCNKLEKYIRHQEKIRALTKIKENIVLRNQIPYSKKISLSIVG